MTYGNVKGCQKSDEPIEPVDTKREVAKVAGLSHDTIAKAKQREAGGAVPQKSEKPPIDTYKEIANVAGLSHDTIAKAKKNRTVMKIRSLNMFDKSFFESLNSHYADYCKKHKAAAATVYISISDFESPVAA